MGGTWDFGRVGCQWYVWNDGALFVIGDGVVGL